VSDTKLTVQEAFDKIVLHLATMDRRSRTHSYIHADGEVCAYRGDDGRKCAIGALIPDELYDRSFDVDGMPVTDFRIEAVLDQVVEYDTTHDRRDAMGLFQALQHIHDAEENWGFTGFGGFGDLDYTAKAYGLIPPEVTVTEDGVVVQVASVFAQ
jgi:hypothetical protein